MALGAGKLFEEQRTHLACVGDAGEDRLVEGFVLDEKLIEDLRREFRRHKAEDFVRGHSGSVQSCGFKIQQRGLGRRQATVVMEILFFCANRSMSSRSNRSVRPASNASTAIFAAAQEIGRASCRERV